MTMQKGNQFPKKVVGGCGSWFGFCIFNFQF
jgi:hypothetical protein